MKNQPTKEQQAAAAIAAKLTRDDLLDDFFDRVSARLDEYDEAAEKTVVARPTKSDH